MALYVGGASLLLHGGGADGSTVFVDETGKTVTPYGNTKISTAQSKFGGSSMCFDGSWGGLTLPPNTAFDFGQDDYTAEAWVYPNAMPTSDAWPSAWNSHMVVFSHGQPNAASGYGLVIGATKIGWSNNDPFVASGLHGMTTGGWYHVAASCQNGTLRMFVSGGKVGEQLITTDFNYPTYNLWVGSETGEGAWFNGHIEDLRIVKGLALYTEDFTPPAAPLGLIDPVQVQIQPITPYNPPLAKYNPAIGKPVMQDITTDLTDRLPYGIPNTPIVNNVNPWEFKGRGRITGTVKNTPNTPVYRLLRLYREPGGLLVKSIWSDPVTGAYTFDGISPGWRYTVVGYDHTQAYRAVVADRVIPEPMP